MVDWKRDMSLLLFSSAPKQVRSLCWSMLLLGLLYCLAGLGLLVVPPPAKKGSPVPPISREVVFLGVAILAVAAVTVVAPFFIRARKRIGVTMAWLSVISFGVYLCAALYGAMRANNFEQMLGPAAFAIVVSKGVTILISKEFNDFMRFRDENVAD